ncbi:MULTISPECIES: hypothetical protein [Streptomyces rochei group]|uniref:hypothetical protein n=1 Tax=Streptomyces rochei group TaxID=2867164 RepID=UPI00187473C7|nr:hypothetical protein [Streptomyces vinaceusdrappus]GHC37451.1 hypothetical protein GCM10010308_65060 [Streptomyces vinaceusdrappus]
MSEQPIGPILDGLGTTIDLDEGDLVASAFVIAKIVEVNGDVSLALVSSEGLSWIEQNGLLASAQQIVSQTSIGRKGDDD